MNIVLCVDVGGSTTKVVGFSSDNNLIGTLTGTGGRPNNFYVCSNRGHFLHQYGVHFKSYFDERWNY